MMNATNRAEYPQSQPSLQALAGHAVIATPASERSDQQLVEACLGGDQSAWAALIRRYQNVIYFFARRYGATATDAADVFQLVCAEIFVSLPRLRKQSSLRSWIMTVSSHQAYHWKRSYLKRVQREGADLDAAFNTFSTPPSTELEELQRTQVMRSAIRQLPPRCQELVRLLFYQDPPLPYDVVAARLGLATGSIGLTRSRCLKKLQRILDSTDSCASDCGGRAADCCAARVHDRGC
jgi:RNA polymerase sigma factor (sigma-70 family)